MPWSATTPSAPAWRAAPALPSGRSRSTHDRPTCRALRAVSRGPREPWRSLHGIRRPDDPSLTLLLFYDNFAFVGRSVKGFFETGLKRGGDAVPRSCFATAAKRWLRGLFDN